MAPETHQELAKTPNMNSYTKHEKLYDFSLEISLLVCLPAAEVRKR